jgi:hypothetical protein
MSLLSSSKDRVRARAASCRRRSAPGALAPRRSAWGGPGAGRVALSRLPGRARPELGHSESRSRRSGYRGGRGSGTPPARGARCTRTRRAGHETRRLQGTYWVRLGVLIVIPHAVLAPLPDVAEHVVQAPGIGSLELHRARSRPRVRVLLLLPVRTVVTVSQVEIDAAVAAVPGDGSSAGALRSPRISRSPV